MNWLSKVLSLFQKSFQSQGNSLRGFHMKRAGPDAETLLQMGDEAIIRYLVEADEPDWNLLKRHPGFSERWVVFFLKRSRAISKNCILDIYHDQELRKKYRVCLFLVRCKFTPAHLAMNLVQVIRWVDLMNTLRTPTLAGAVRQRIETRIMEQLPRLALGEKITLAKQAPKGLIKHIRVLPEIRVIRALFNNPHFTYEDALFMSNYARIGAEVLGELAMSQKWRRFKEVRKSLLRNPRTPNSVVYPLASSMNEHDLRQVIRDQRITVYCRRNVSLL